MSIEFEKPLTYRQLSDITDLAKKGIYSNRDYFEFVLDNWNDVLELMDSKASKMALKAAKPLMKLALHRK
jgi:hypothetical protein